MTSDRRAKRIQRFWWRIFRVSGRSLRRPVLWQKLMSLWKVMTGYTSMILSVTDLSYWNQRQTDALEGSTVSAIGLDKRACAY
jgi:hypothetical protein